MRKRKSPTEVVIQDRMREVRFRALHSEEYGRVVEIRRRGGAPWIVGIPGYIAHALRPGGMLLRSRIRRIKRHAEERPRDLTGVKAHPTIQTVYRTNAIARRRAKGKVARRSRTLNYRRAKRLGRTYA